MVLSFLESVYPFNDFLDKNRLLFDNNPSISRMFITFTNSLNTIKNNYGRTW